MAKAAAQAGWLVTLTRNGHLRWQPPSGAAIFTPSTPSCYRGTLNAISTLKNAGLTAGPVRLRGSKRDKTRQRAAA